VDAIESAANGADEIIAGTPLELSVVCPNINEDDIIDILGVDLNGLAEMLSREYDELAEEVHGNIAKVQRALDHVDSGLIEFENTVVTIDDLMWIIPGLLFAVSMIVALSMLGVLLAWKEKSGLRFQRVMSYFVLPMLIVVCIGSWIVVLCASFGTMVTSGKC
jgi:hypothetical protein